MASSKKGPLFAFCTVCNSDINIAGGGVYDVKRHCDGVKHKKSLQSFSAQPSISSLMSSASKESLSSKVLKSKVFFAKFVAEHNLSCSTADPFTKLCKKMFPDSNMAGKFSCARRLPRTRCPTTHLYTLFVVPLDLRYTLEFFLVCLCKSLYISYICLFLAKSHYPKFILNRFFLEFVLFFGCWTDARYRVFLLLKGQCSWKELLLDVVSVVEMVAASD